MKGSDPLSFEDLGTVYRMEKKSPTLSPVRKDLYPATAALIVFLRTEYEKFLSEDPDSIICEGANQRRKKAISLSNEIIEMRMGKIASLALLGARGGHNLLEHLTPEEREYYDNILEISRRHVTIMNRLSGKRKFETPDIDREPIIDRKEKPLPDVPEPKNIIADEKIPDVESAEEAIEEESVKEVSEGSSYIDAEKDHAVESEETPEEEMAVVRILEDLPRFSGPDRNYELFAEDIVRMPKIMAMVLVNREKAFLINPEP